MSVHQRASALALALAIAIITTACSAHSAPGAAVADSPVPDPAPLAAPSASSTSATVGGRAQHVLDELLAAQPHGTAKAAAYVQTTLGALNDSLDPQTRIPITDYVGGSSDAIVVVKVFGSCPNAHRGPVGADTDATAITVAYDLESGVALTTTFETGLEPPDLPGAPNASANLVPLIDLRRLGTPQTLRLGS